MKHRNISQDWWFTSPEQKEKTLVDIPHDYSISLPRNPQSVSAATGGYFEGSLGRYQKYLDLGEEDHVILDVDGAYMCARVSINDDQILTHPNGYTPFLVDLSDKIRKNRPNKLGLLTMHLQPSSRWYSGAGLYRDISLWVGGKVRIEPWDVFVKTDSIGETNAQMTAEIVVTSDEDTTGILQGTLVDATGQTAVVFRQDMALSSGKNSFCPSFVVENPLCWSPDTPHLYTLTIQILIHGEEADCHHQDFGIRTVTANAKDGLLLNGKPIKLRGGCIHHDHGVLGAAAFPAAEYRKLSKLKAAGFNAVRTAHNPPSLTFLNLCDRLGILVMDEIFDVWNMPKTRADYSFWFADWWDKDVKSMVLRDRNHPSVISYSIGNEIAERNGRSDGGLWAERISNEIRKYDNTKLVTAGVCVTWEIPEKDAPKEYREDFMNGKTGTGGEAVDDQWDLWTEPHTKPLDIVGYNYLYRRYEYDHEKYPNRVIWGSETHALTFYQSWEQVMKHPYVIGDFTWTAYDNLGECGAGRFAWEKEETVTGITLMPYPWRCCYQGDFDICGYRRPQSYFREAIWKENPEIKIFTTHPKHNGEGFSGTGWHWYDVQECWTFEDAYSGEPVKVEVYTIKDEVRFFLNGKAVGTAKPVEGIATIEIPYEKGELVAKVYQSDTRIGSATLSTVDRAEKILVEAEQETFLADHRDLCYFAITVTDSHGRRITDAEPFLTCEVQGGELLGIYGGHPANEDQYTAPCCHAFEGRALAVVRSKTPGKVTITVSSENLTTGSATVLAKEV